MSPEKRVGYVEFSKGKGVVVDLFEYDRVVFMLGDNKIELALDHQTESVRVIANGTGGPHLLFTPGGGSNSGHLWAKRMK